MKLNDELRKQRIIDSEQMVPLLERDSYVSEWYGMKRGNSGAKLSKTGEMITVAVCLVIIVFMVSMILYGTVFRNSDMFPKFMGVFMYEVFYVSAFLMSLRFYKRGQGFISVYDPVRNIVSMMIFGLGVILVVPLYLFLNKEDILFFGLPSIYFPFCIPVYRNGETEIIYPEGSGQMHRLFQKGIPYQTSRLQMLYVTGS